MNDIVLALDPSGNFTEGKGTTGFAFSRDGFIFKAGQICAAEYKTQMEYWKAIMDLIDSEFDYDYNTYQLVCEDYRLYASASQAQINSNLETPQLIGAIKYHCYMNNLPITMQMASEVKERWSNEVLQNKGMLKYDYFTRAYWMGDLKLGDHSLDAVRHCLHFITFKLKLREGREEYEKRKAKERENGSYQRTRVQRYDERPFNESRSYTSTSTYRKNRPEQFNRRRSNY